MKPSEVLKKARGLITNSQNWNRGTLIKRGSDYPGGYSCCALGAVGLAIGATTIVGSDGATSGSLYAAVGAEPATEVLAQATGSTSPGFNVCSTVYGYNDSASRGHTEVLAWFDKAIEMAQSTEIAGSGAEEVEAPKAVVTADGVVDFGDFDEPSTALKQRVDRPQVAAKAEPEVEVVHKTEPQIVDLGEVDEAPVKKDDKVLV